MLNRWVSRDIIFPNSHIPSHSNLTNLPDYAQNGFIDHFAKCIQIKRVSKGVNKRTISLTVVRTPAFRIPISFHREAQSPRFNLYKQCATRSIEMYVLCSNYAENLYPLFSNCSETIMKSMLYKYNTFRDERKERVLGKVILKLFLMLSFAYYVQNYASIIRPSL